MKRINKTFAALCLALVACVLAQAALPSGLFAAGAARAETSVALNRNKATILSGETLQLTLEGTPAT